MPDIPAEIREAAIRAAARRIGAPGHQVAEDVLDAVAPLLAEAVAAKITAHAERRQPPSAAARNPRYLDYHRHFATAARIAAGAFTTEAEMLAEAAQAFNRGDYTACRDTEPEPPEGAAP